MKPIHFPQSNKILEKPVNMTDEECSPLSVFTDGKQCVSCWKPTLKERLSILFNGRLWLCVISGQTQPPVWIDGSKTVFETKKKNKR